MAVQPTTAQCFLQRLKQPLGMQISGRIFYSPENGSHWQVKGGATFFFLSFGVLRVIQVGMVSFQDSLVVLSIWTKIKLRKNYFPQCVRLYLVVFKHL